LPVNIAPLKGSGTDADGSIASYNWKKIIGPTSGTIVNPSFAVTSATGLTQGVYKYELTVTDNNGVSTKDTMQVIENQLPIAKAGTEIIITLPANSATLNGIGTDIDGTIASYQWIKISGPATGAISNGILAQASANTLVQGIYQFELTVTDNIGAIG